MPDQATKRRVTQTHIDELAKVSGPVYGVRLIDDLPIGTGSMRQACPSRADLESVREVNERTAAAYEVLLDHYRRHRERLQSVHEWFLQKAPEHYKGCGLCIDVDAILSR